MAKKTRVKPIVEETPIEVVPAKVSLITVTNRTSGLLEVTLDKHYRIPAGGSIQVSEAYRTTILATHYNQLTVK